MRRILSNLKLSQWILLLFAIPLSVQLIFIYTLNGQIEKAEEERRREMVDKEKKLHLSKILRLIMTSATGSAIYTLSPDARKQVKVSHKDAAEAIKEEFAVLEGLSSDNADELKAIAQIRKLSKDIFNQVTDVTGLVDRHNVIDALEQLKSMKDPIRSIDSKMDDLTNAQTSYESAQTENFSQDRKFIKYLLLLGTIVNIAVSTLLAMYIYRSATRRLSVVVDNSLRLASNVPLHPPVSGSDEIAHLDKVFRAMARSLEEMSRKESAVIENALDVICSIDERGTMTKVSAASLPLFGYEPDHLLGRNFRSIILADDIEQTAQSLQAIKAGDSHQDFENRVKRSDDAIINVLWSAHWSQEEKSFFCVAHDITQRKRAENLLREAEARIRLIVQSMPIGLVIIDENGVIELTNPAIEQMFGKSAAQLKDTNLAALLGKPETESEHEFALQIIEKTKNHALETEGHNASGLSVPIEISMNEFETLEGKRLLVLIIDVTERHEVERLKQEFISMVSHELRSPLNSVLGFLDNLPMGIYGELNEKGKDKVQVAERSITRLIKLINDLLDLDRAETRGLSMEICDTALQPVLQRSVEAVKSLAEKDDITIDVDTTDATIPADGDRLVQVVVNLLSNAIKFSPRSSTVHIAVNVQQEWVEVRVIDQGSGIAEAARSRIFERFQQIAASDWKEKGGSGLGLPISKAIVEQLSGSIGVDSEEGKGSQFWFRLPIKLPVPMPDPAQASSALQASPVSQTEASS